MAQNGHAAPWIAEVAEPERTGVLVEEPGEHTPKVEGTGEAVGHLPGVAYDFYRALTLVEW